MNEDGKLQTEIDLDGLSKLFNASFYCPKMNLN